jgi:hypothetical protein
MTNKSLYKDMVWKTLVTQVGGKHYESFKIQPARFINENMLPFAEGNVIKYVCRHSLKNKKQDLEKAKHYIDMIIERDYSDVISD